MSKLLRYSCAALLMLGVFACGSRAKQEESPTKPVKTVTEAIKPTPVAQDQIEFTRNVDPSTVKESSLPAPTPEPAQLKIDPSKRPTATSTPAVTAAGPVRNSPVTTAKPTRLVVEDEPTETAPPTSTAPAAAPPTNDERVGTNEAQNEPALPSPPDHGPWNALLQRFVDDAGNVDYAGLKQQEGKLDAYLASLQAAAPRADWGRKASLAYWINAYNAFTVKRILNDYPVKAITDLDGGDPWKVKWINIDGKTYSLNNIEHDIIRPTFKEPRIHFAVNCAATSCPPLPNRAFTAENLTSMLETRTRAFIRNPTYNQTSGEVKVSKIFDWYGEDFGNLRDYLNRYLATSLPEDQEIGFREYDWSLNQQ